MLRRQELDLRPQLERLDALLIRSAGVDPAGMRFAFRPLWQLSATEQAGVALQKAQASAVYAGLKLWPVAATAALVRSQLLEDGTYPGAGAAFGADAIDPKWAQSSVADYSPNQPRNELGEWTVGGGSGPAVPLTGAAMIHAMTGFGSPSGLDPSHQSSEKRTKLAASADDPQRLKMARDAANAAGLNRAQRRILHDAISGQGINDFQTILNIAKGIKQGQIP